MPAAAVAVPDQPLKPPSGGWFIREHPGEIEQGETLSMGLSRGVVHGDHGSADKGCVSSHLYNPLKKGPLGALFLWSDGPPLR